MNRLLLFSCSFFFAGSAAASDHWSAKPRSKPVVPTLNSPWVRNPIDAFVLARLNKTGLKPAADAEATTLIRRVTFDLTGLPPTPDEIDAFLRDTRAKPQAAYEALVDRLLASPRYGERWGRHWLDVVRYAESEGFEYDRFRPGAWRYRDYVIGAFNDDLPFDRFLLEQIAGDEISQDHTKLVAAGFHRLGPVRRNAGNALVAFSRNEVLTEMTDAVGATFLGLTMGCARCHDHRFDDITQKDYYRLQAYFAALEEHDLVLADIKTRNQWQVATDKVTEQIKFLQRKLEGKTNAKLEQQIADLRLRMPAPLPTISTVKNGTPTPIHLLKRGDADRKGVPVQPRPLSMLVAADAPELPFDVEKPRTKLAAWLNDPDHPLVPRVWVNRVWQYHFGAGIVATPNDLGVNGSPPSHPELLDWLADEFVANGRRVKPLHRMILLSSTYRQASAAVDAAKTTKLDPDNRLLSHFSRRRLSAEEIRDAMLAISGQLNLKAGGPSVMLPVDADLVNLLYDPLAWVVTSDVKEHARRSVYLAVKRNLQLPFGRVFDQPDAAISCARRESSTHALQALELLNGKLANEQAEALAERLRQECGDDHAKQVERAFRLSAGRAPTMREREVALEFLRTQPLREFALAMFNLNAFLYVD